MNIGIFLSIMMIAHIRIDHGARRPKVEAGYLQHLKPWPQARVILSILVVDGRPVVGIRWQLDALSGWLGKKARWEVRLGVFQDEAVGVITERWME